MDETEGFLDQVEKEEQEDTEENNDEIVVENTEEPKEPAYKGENSLLQPVSDIDDVAELYDRFEEIKENLLKDSDKTEISGNVHVNKSGWRKIATAFNVSVETIYEQRILEDGIVKYRVKARATAPNGKVATGVANCASNESNHMEKHTEKRENRPDVPGVNPEDIIWIDNAWRRLLPPKEVNEHNILATSATRAKNRAISDCVGGGEVSVEEITADDVL